MRLTLVLSLTALFAGYLALLVLRQKLRDRATQRRFMQLRLHHIVGPTPMEEAARTMQQLVEDGVPLWEFAGLVSGPAHSQERYDSLTRLIQERTAK